MAPGQCLADWSGCKKGVVMKIMAGRWRVCLQGRAPCDPLYIVWLCWGAALLFYVLGSDAYLWPAVPIPLILLFWLMERVRMFGRKSNSVAATPSKVTVIAAGACFRGDLQVEGDLEVHGQLIGSIQLIDGVLRIMQGGSVEGEVNAPNVTINGLLDGTCSTAEVEILENGKMQGIFKGGSLSICKGGHFIGHSHPVEAVGTETAPVAASVNQGRSASQVQKKSNVSPLPKEPNNNENAQLAKQA